MNSLPIIEPAEKQRAKEHVDQGHLHLDEGVVVHPDREAAKDADKDGAEQWNLGNLSSCVIHEAASATASPP